MKAGRPVTAESFRPLELKSQSYFWAMGLGAATWLRLSRQPELSSRGCVSERKRGRQMLDLFLALREARPYPMVAFAIISTIVAIALFAEASGR